MQQWSFTHWLTRLLPLALLLVVVLAACSSESAAPADGPPDAARGEALFAETLRLTGTPNCASCHVVQAGQPEIVGPSLVGVGTAAGERVDGMSAEEYLRIAIVVPNEHLLRGYAAGIMPRTYGATLTEQQIDDLVAYMLTLEAE